MGRGNIVETRKGGKDQQQWAGATLWIRVRVGRSTDVRGQLLQKLRRTERRTDRRTAGWTDNKRLIKSVKKMRIKF